MKQVVPRIWILLGALAAACVIDTVPLPEDEPTPHDEDERNGGATGDAAPSVGGGVGIQAEALYYAENDETTILVGLGGAVPGIAKVIVINAARVTEDTAMANVDGSFALAVNAAIGETIEISIELDGEVVDSLSLYLQASSVDGYTASAELDAGAAPPEPQNTDDNVTAYPVDAPAPAVKVAAPIDGVAAVTGDPGVLFPGITVVVANLARGASAAAVVASDGSFTTTVVAQSGDSILLFAVENAGANAGSSTTTLLVP